VLPYLIDDFLNLRSLAKLLAAYEPPPIPVSLIYPSQRQVPLKLRAFLGFSIPQLRQRLGYKNA
jgi:DNA-binding transcriptional LysR family regulator